ncbi:Excitatory amino acid transporter [Toxocara canis]|uniref:Amino acid transporter n=1 Tax=Toxocara canis TaxID=6265 RepID=A0A0B2VBK9_TOXCA|nr:Excitatory amino acid transporter [Toxocara canis]
MGNCSGWTKKNILLLLTAASVFVGVAVGFGLKLVPKLGPAVIETIGLLGELFIRMLQMTVLPLTGVALALAIAPGKRTDWHDPNTREGVSNIAPPLSTQDALFDLFRYSPVGIACLIAARLLEVVDLWRALSALGSYMATVISGFLIQMFFVQPLIYMLLTRKNPLTFMKGLLQNGTALYEAVSATFIAQLIKGYNLTVTRIVIISVTAIITSVGAAPVPSAVVVPFSRFGHYACRHDLGTRLDIASEYKDSGPSMVKTIDRNGDTKDNVVESPLRQRHRAFARNHLCSLNSNTALCGMISDGNNGIFDTRY